MILPTLPQWVRRVESALPQYPPTAIAALGLNLFLRRLFADDEIARLEGKTICVHMQDAGMRLTLRIERGGYSACDEAITPDATISAEARDYVQLALRNVDPDTLFFERRLMISGDTDLGLLVKNALDRIELPLPHSVLQVLQRHIR